MAFTEKTKNEVKRKAHFKCCVCRGLFVAVHHIIPQAHGGSDDIDNAAPLCPNCHDKYGDNPEKRKVIKQMRGLHYELCEKSEEHPDVNQFSQKLDNLVEGFKDQKKTLDEIKSHVSGHFQNKVEEITHASSLDELMTATGSTTVSQIREPIGAYFEAFCENCGFTTYQLGAVYCPNCGNKL